jgi:hypothetical protein
MLVEAASVGRTGADRDSAAAENGDTASEGRNTLADRIRALQSTASRVATTTN